MVAVYVILGIFAFLIVYIAIKYSINSIKIKNKKKPQKAEEKSSPKQDVKIDKKSDEQPKTLQKTVIVEKSLNESAMQKAFEESKQKELEIKYEVAPTINNEMYDDANMTELERALLDAGKKRRFGKEKSIIEQKHMSSETNQIGIEGPTQKQNISANEQKTQQDEIDISKMTDDMKKILISDILNKKY